MNFTWNKKGIPIAYSDDVEVYMTKSSSSPANVIGFKVKIDGKYLALRYQYAVGEVDVTTIQKEVESEVANLIGRIIKGDRA